MTVDGLPENGTRATTVYIKDSEFATEEDGSSTMVSMGVSPEPLGPNDAIGGYEQTVIKAAIRRLEVYQSMEGCDCVENEEAIVCLSSALEVLERRPPPRDTKKRDG